MSPVSRQASARDHSGNPGDNPEETRSRWPAPRWTSRYGTAYQVTVSSHRVAKSVVEDGPMNSTPSFIWLS
jgi:hypothetical protein